MPILTNYLDDLLPILDIELKDTPPVLEQHHLSPFDIINLCGGIPSPEITSVRIIMNSTFSSALSVQISTDQYEVVRNMDLQIGRIDNNFKRLHTTALAPNDDLNWSGYYFWAELGYENTDIEEYRAWATEMRREEPTLSELVQSESGRQLWKQSGFTWIGNFHLSDDHPCMDYLRRHLERKGIEFVP